MFRSWNRITLAAGSAAFLCVALVLPAYANVIIVNNICTLGNAIRSANDNDAVGGCADGGATGPDTIVLTQDVEVTFAANPALGEGLPAIISDMVILGFGRSVTRVSDSLFRLFTLREDIFGTGSLVISDTTISGGATTAATQPGGGFYVDPESILVMQRCTVSGNSAQFGGGIRNDRNMIILDSTITQNEASGGGAGLDSFGGSNTVVNSTFSGNVHTGTEGAGIAIEDAGGHVSVNLSTFSGNSSASASSSTLKGLANSISIQRSIIANTVGGGVACQGIRDYPGNKDDDGTCSGDGDLTGLDPMLADNGGPTRTHALLAGSNAIDHGLACGQQDDQRGSPRDDNLCDSGSFEFGALPPDEPEFDSAPNPGTELAFGNVEVGASSTPETVEVTNLGGANLELICSLSGANSDQFDISACPTPVGTINPENVTVTCQPTSAGVKSASLDIATNDADEMNVSWPLLCTGLMLDEEIVFKDSFEDP